CKCVLSALAWRRLERVLSDRQTAEAFENLFTCVHLVAGVRLRTRSSGTAQCQKNQKPRHRRLSSLAFREGALFQASGRAQAGNRRVSQGCARESKKRARLLRAGPYLPAARLLQIGRVGASTSNRHST